jgi:hypothetical protein
MDLLMGIGIALPVVATTAIGTVTGVGQGVAEQRRQNADSSNQTRMMKFHLDVHLDARTARSKSPAAKLANRIVTLRNDKLWLDPTDHETGQPADEGKHPFTGFYVAYPDSDREYTRGLVSTISRDPPVLNWIFVDKDTLEVKYASRTGSIAHHVGSFDWTTDEPEDSAVTLEDWEGFVAIEEPGGKGWALYFDKNDDGLKAVKNGRKSCEVSLMRRLLDVQDLNKWGLKEEGNIGFKTTKEI